MKRAILTVALLVAGCGDGATTGGGAPAGGGAGDGTSATTPAALIPITVTSMTGRHVFRVEPARTPAEQERGLMFRTDLTPDGGMLFAPYPAEGGGPRAANFWMKNTPSPLDIVFIRPDGTIARIAENTVPFSEAPVQSGEVVGAVLELMGGRTSELGIAEGDRVSWPGQAR